MANDLPVKLESDFMTPTITSMNQTMNTFAGLSLRAVAIVAAFLFAGLPAAFAAEEDIGNYAGTVVVPEGVTQEQVQRAIVAALIGREWGVRKKSDGIVVGHLKHRSNEAILTLLYDDTKVDLHCVGWAINKSTGERRRPEQPAGWLKNIRKDIARHLSLVVPNT